MGLFVFAFLYIFESFFTEILITGTDLQIKYFNRCRSNSYQIYMVAVCDNKKPNRINQKQVTLFPEI